MNFALLHLAQNIQNFFMRQAIKIQICLAFFQCYLKAYLEIRRNFQIRKIELFGRIFAAFWSNNAWNLFKQKNVSKRRFWNKFSIGLRRKQLERFEQFKEEKTSDHNEEKNVKIFNFAYFPKIFELQIRFLMKIIIFKFSFLNKHIHCINLIFRRQMGSNKMWFTLKILKC